jgi:hypothetical protein
MTMSAYEAVAKIESIIHGSAAAAGLSAKLTRDKDMEDLEYGACMDNSAPKGTVSVGRSYSVEGLSDAQVIAGVKALRDYWVQHGWSAGQPRGNGTTEMVISLTYGQDGLSGHLDGGNHGINVVIRSSCFWYDGVPGHTHTDKYGVATPPPDLDAHATPATG